MCITHHLTRSYMPKWSYERPLSFNKDPYDVVLDLINYNII